MNEQFIKPCPWCGGKEIKVEYMSELECFSAWCLACKASGPKYLMPTALRIDQMTGAIYLWNLRNDEQAPTKEIEKD